MQRRTTSSTGELQKSKIVVNKSVKRPKSPEDDENGYNKKRKRPIPVNADELSLSCKYISCQFITDNYNTFLMHLQVHVYELEGINDELDCMWEDCSFKTDNILTLRQHLHYHGYHTKLMNIGSNLVEANDLPMCQQKSRWKIPSLPGTYACEWSDCDIAFFEYQIFLDHVKCHINCKEEVIRCWWQGCNNKFATIHKLQDHVKTHTKEKLAACPTCGHMFASRTKFTDHRKRQLSSDLQDYQCVQCSKLFASERLLRDHTRVHINHYKCHLCDMTCSKPSMLSKHIRYRHLPDRPFKCDICTHSTVSYQDLLVHRETHNDTKILKCDKCEFSCRTKWSFIKHQSQKHDNDWEARYACHCCEKLFTRGALLTKHLIKKHDFHWPSGHSRFLYKQDIKTGLFHLQVVRYESLEVTQEMIQGNAACQQALTQNYKYECKASADNPLSYELKIANENSDKKTEKNNTAINQKYNLMEEFNNDGDSFRFEYVDMDSAAYESDDTDNLIICQ